MIKTSSNGGLTSNSKDIANSRINEQVAKGKISPNQAEKLKNQVSSTGNIHDDEINANSLDDIKDVGDVNIDKMTDFDDINGLNDIDRIGDM